MSQSFYYHHTWILAIGTHRPVNNKIKWAHNRCGMVPAPLSCCRHGRTFSQRRWPRLHPSQAVYSHTNTRGKAVTLHLFFPHILSWRTSTKMRLGDRWGSSLKRTPWLGSPTTKPSPGRSPWRHLLQTQPRWAAALLLIHIHIGFVPVNELAGSPLIKAQTLSPS